MRSITTIRLSLLSVVTAGLAACSNDSLGPTHRPAAGTASFNTGLPGNPSTALYKFNMIGVSDPKQASLDGDQGKRMFVNLDGHSTINLQKGDTFDILDANATDRDGGLFQLPDPDPDNDGVTTYGVYVRTLGTPGGSAKLTSCVTGDPDGGGPATTGTFCSVDTVTISRSAGKPKVTNVSKELLTTCVDLDGNGTCDKRIFLFDDSLLNYAWSVDNNGLRNAQVWFFPIPQNIGLNP
jgi:hypothetical protein